MGSKPRLGSRMGILEGTWGTLRSGGHSPKTLWWSWICPWVLDNAMGPVIWVFPTKTRDKGLQVAE
jgi:hypothetical protein